MERMPGGRAEGIQRERDGVYILFIGIKYAVSKCNARTTRPKEEELRKMSERTRMQVPWRWRK